MKTVRLWVRYCLNGSEEVRSRTALLVCVPRCLTSSPVNVSMLVRFCILNNKGVTYPFRLPICLEFVIVKLCQCCCGTSGWQHGTREIIVNVSGSVWGTRVFAIIAMPFISIDLIFVSNPLSIHWISTNRAGLGWSSSGEEVVRMAGY